ncbi:MAG TPA: hypothetical protein VKH46_04625 [Thermoanaerobaculia bacterium]|jgi:hypothetical protein|nr:hypothetical protein [Thermoanaerobaculia bacterium]
MKKTLLLMLAAAALPAMLRAESWKNVALVDSMCAGKAAVEAAPDSHTTKCAIQCQASGYGILTADGRYLKLDRKGNEQAAAALKATNKADHLRVDLEGERQGDEIEVRSLSLN